jgi:hypothetical protein
MKVSDCCKAEIEKENICTFCEEECKVIDYEPNDEQIYNTFNCEGGINF